METAIDFSQLGGLGLDASFFSALLSLPGLRAERFRRGRKGANRGGGSRVDVESQKRMILERETKGAGRSAASSRVEAAEEKMRPLPYRD